VNKLGNLRRAHHFAVRVNSGKSNLIVDSLRQGSRNDYWCQEETRVQAYFIDFTHISLEQKSIHTQIHTQNKSTTSGYGRSSTITTVDGAGFGLCAGVIGTCTE
jgi:hypothetical protein